MKKITKKLLSRYLKKVRKITSEKSIPTWTSSDGRKIPINKLLDSHLINILRFLHRRKRWQDINFTLAADCSYGNLRKELSALNSMDTYIGKRVAIYDVLKQELARRASEQEFKDYQPY